jgi:hypothetical protein
MLAGIELLLPSDDAAVEWVEFVRWFGAEAGVTPRRWADATHGSVAAAEVLRENGCVTPTVASAAPPADVVFRPLVQPTPVMTWSMMISPVTTERADLDAFVHCVRSLDDDDGGWLGAAGAELAELV